MSSPSKAPNAARSSPSLGSRGRCSEEHTSGNPAAGDSAVGQPSVWFVYILRTARGHLYTGITTDVDRRARQHERGRGAKALRGHESLRLVYRAEVGSQSLALRLEARIKRLRKPHKERLVREQPSIAHLCRTLLGDSSAIDAVPRRQP